MGRSQNSRILLLVFKSNMFAFLKNHTVISRADWCDGEGYITSFSYDCNH